MNDQPCTRLSCAAKRLRTQRLREAHRLLNEVYQAYLSSLNNNNNDINNINANGLDNDRFNNNNSLANNNNNNNNDNNNIMIFIIQSEALPLVSFLCRINLVTVNTKNIFWHSPFFLSLFCRWFNVKSVKFLDEIPLLHLHYYFYHGNYQLTSLFFNLKFLSNPFPKTLLS